MPSRKAGARCFGGGYGRFYQKNRVTNLDELIPLGVFTNAFTVSFPLTGVDRGPSQGQFPTDPSW